MKTGVVFFSGSNVFNLMDASSIPTGITLLNNSHLTGLNNPQRGALDPTGHYFAVAMNGTPYLFVFNLYTGQSITVNTLPAAALDCHFSADGAWLAVGHQYKSPGYYLSVYSTSTWQRVVTTPNFTNNCTSVAFDPTNTYLAVGFESSPYLTILNVGTWTTVSSTPTVSSCTSVAWSPDGLRLASGLTGSPYLQVYNTSDWSTIAGTPNPATAPTNLTYSPAGNFLACTLYTSTLAVYKISDWSQVKYGTGHAKVQMAFTSDDAYLVYVAYASNDELKVYQTSDWSSITGHTVLDLDLRGVFLGQIVTDLSGTVTDITTTPRSTTVRLYSRSTGQLIDQKTSNGSGDFSFTTWIKGEVDVITLCPVAQEADYNDHILRGVTS